MSADRSAGKVAAPFQLGVNYWPPRTAMRWWTAFDPAEVAADFQRIAGSGFDSLRFFLLWEDFQPAPDRIDSLMLSRLIAILDEAAHAGLAVMPTLFTGHMSGVNWIPRWALENTPSDGRFRVVSGGRVVPSGLANWYSNESIVRAQVALASEVASAIAGHTALWAWDLGNENSNCTVPPSKAHGREWLVRVTDAIRTADSRTRITLGLHMEDLEQDRNLGPRQAAEVCDFLTMHGYPGYAAWAEGPTDERVLPFLLELTRWLGGGADVLFSEFGVPTAVPLERSRDSAMVASGPALVEEQDAASYVDRALQGLLECGGTGAMLWCYSDYDAASWKLPPLDLALHERSFGLWRADATPKPAVAAVEAFAHRRPLVHASEARAPAWIDRSPDEFYRCPGVELPRLYRRYRDALGPGPSPVNVRG